MARVKLLGAVAFDRATLNEQGITDPAIVVLGELPGAARPFSVRRLYQGPQGSYEESFVLLDPDDVVVFEREYRYIELRGEMFDDHFEDSIRADVYIDKPGEHKLVFLIDGAEVGRIPVFIEAPESLAASGAMEAALSASLQKSSVVWLDIPQPDGSDVRRPAWYVFDQGKVHVITGPGEQDLTGIAAVDEIRLTVKSKDLLATVGQVPATVEVIDNGSDEFSRIGELGLGVRLNSPDGPAALDRWRETCTMVALTPRI